MKLETVVTVTPLNETEIGPEPAPVGTEVVILVEVKEVTTAGVPLNTTVGVDIKLVPVIITVVPTPAAVGLKLEIVGDGNTVKLPELCTVTPPVVTDIFPDVAPAGTVAVIVVEVEAVTVAVVLLNFTTLLAAVVLKFVPVIITVAPTAPLVGLKPEMDGVGSTVKLDALVIVMPLVDIEIGPEPAPAGTEVVMLVAVEDDTVAAIPLN